MESTEDLLARIKQLEAKLQKAVDFEEKIKWQLNMMEVSAWRYCAILEPQVDDYIIHSVDTALYAPAGRNQIKRRISDIHYLITQLRHSDAVGAVHIKVQLKDGSVRYGLSDMALRLMPRDVLIQRISSEIATELLRLLDEKHPPTNV